jgi:hypothetical protein
MPKVSMEDKLAIPLEEVWKLIGGFNALPDWHPAVAKSTLEEGGRVRRLDLVGGGSIVERLESFDENEKTYSYSIVAGPLPVANYKATIKVRKDPEGKGSIVQWSSEFAAAGAPENDAVEVVKGIYKTGLDNLAKMFGR